jgi:hypothetical protein
MAKNLSGQILSLLIALLARSKFVSTLLRLIALICCSVPVDTPPQQAQAQ